MFIRSKLSTNEVYVVHGVYAEALPVAGKTVGSIRRQLRDIACVSSDAEALLNGKKVGDDTVVHGGESLEFVKIAGQKGGFHKFWSEQDLIDFFGEEDVNRMREAGMKLSMNPTITFEEVKNWDRWRQSQNSKPPKIIPFAVNIDKEELTYKGRTHPCERAICVVLQCLLDAGGEIRSTGDIQRAYPEEVWDGRLQQTIKRKLFKHPSGVGNLVESVQKRGYRLRLEDGSS